MVGARGIPIFGNRSRTFCFFFQWPYNRLLGQVPAKPGGLNGSIKHWLVSLLAGISKSKVFRGR